MPRNFVICCDGTNNQFGTNNTNVVRLIQSLERDPARQRLYYDPGVGTLPEPGVWTWLGKKLSDLGGLAFGGGLGWKVEEAYSYLMDSWEPDDKVFLFGFSRGAYSVRVLAGLLHALGLMPRGNQNLVPYVMRLFKGSRKRREQPEYWMLLNQFRRTFARRVREGDDDRRFPIHFLGVWDTVSSVGWVWDPVTFPYTSRNPSIDTIRHAVSVDERRWFFRQNLMKRADRKAGQQPQDLKEVWFSGVHSDVGGGYPAQGGGLWQEPFKWILGEAKDAGLWVDDGRLVEILRRPAPSPPEFTENAWTDAKHESLTPAWWPAEFFPKLKTIRKGEGSSATYSRVPKLGLGRHREIEEGALIYWPTLRRIRDDANYAPPNMSSEFLNTVRKLQDVPQALPYHKHGNPPLTMRAAGL